MLVPGQPRTQKFFIFNSCSLPRENQMFLVKIGVLVKRSFSQNTRRSFGFLGQPEEFLQSRAV